MENKKKIKKIKKLLFITPRNPFSGRFSGDVVRAKKFTEHFKKKFSVTLLTLDKNISSQKKIKNLLKGDIIFWKGHVGICISKSRFIHAYGPKKKVIEMSTIQTIKLIDKTANLKVKKVSNISNY